MLEASQILHSSSRYRLTYTPRRSDFVVVTFDHWVRGKKAFEERAGGGGLYEKRGWSQLHVASAANDWFLAPEMDDVISSARQAASSHARTITCGYSMGACAALKFAGALNARRAVAISPQFAVDPAAVPWEDRWSQDRRMLPWQREVFDAVAAACCDAVLVYDPWHTRDRRHVARYRERMPGWKYLSLPGADHPAMLPFQDTHESAHVVAGLIDGTLSPSDVRALYRRSRRRSVTYWAVLAQRAERHPRAVHAAIENCLRQPKLSPDVFFKLGLAACQVGNDAKGAELLERAIGLSQKPPPWWALRLAEARARLLAGSSR